MKAIRVSSPGDRLSVTKASNVVAGLALDTLKRRRDFGSLMVDRLPGLTQRELSVKYREGFLWHGPDDIVDVAARRFRRAGLNVQEVEYEGCANPDCETCAAMAHA